MRGRIGQGKGMRKGTGKGKGEIDGQKDREAWWFVKEERCANEQWGRMSDDDLDMGGDRTEFEAGTVGCGQGREVEKSDGEKEWRNVWVKRWRAN